MSRTDPTNFELHLAPCDAEGRRCEPARAILWEVRMKTGAGQFDILSDALPKRMAARKMRQIRQEMAEMWWKAQMAKRKQGAH